MCSVLWVGRRYGETRTSLFHRMINSVALDAMQRCMRPPKSTDGKREKKLQDMVAAEHTRSPVTQKDIDLYLLGRVGPTVVACLRQSEAEVT